MGKKNKSSIYLEKWNVELLISIFLQWNLLLAGTDIDRQRLESAGI